MHCNARSVFVWKSPQIINIWNSELRTMLMLGHLASLLSESSDPNILQVSWAPDALPRNSPYQVPQRMRDGWDLNSFSRPVAAQLKVSQSWTAQWTHKVRCEILSTLVVWCHAGVSSWCSYPKPPILKSTADPLVMGSFIVPSFAGIPAAWIRQPPASVAGPHISWGKEPARLVTNGSPQNSRDVQRIYLTLEDRNIKRFARISHHWLQNLPT